MFSSVKFPSKSLVTPIFSPATIIVAPGSGSPSASDKTIPVIVC